MYIQYLRTEKPTVQLLLFAGECHIKGVQFLHESPDMDVDILKFTVTVCTLASYLLSYHKSIVQIVKMTEIVALSKY